MKLRSILIIAGTSVYGIANASLVGNLYLAQGGGSTSNGYVNQLFSDSPTFSTVSGNVVTVGASGWNVANVQGEYLDFGKFISSGVNAGVLTVSTFSSTPNANHISGISSGAGVVYSGAVTASITNVVGNLFNFETNTTGIAQLQGLAAGTYLFTFTPDAAFATYGQAYNTMSTDVSQDGWMRNSGAGFALPSGANWGTFATNFPTNTTDKQFSLGINGTNAVPEPTTVAVLGLGALGLLRRKRKNS
jgi:hypothetical protein